MNLKWDFTTLIKNETETLLQTISRNQGYGRLSTAFPSFQVTCVCVWLNCVQLFTTLWIVAHQVPLSMGFSGQEYRSGSLFPSPGDLPNPGIEPQSPTFLS